METRKEQIEKAVFDIYNGEEEVADMGYAKFGRLCAEWADEHPYCPWVSVKDKMPDEDKTVLLWLGGCYKVAVLRDDEWWECTGWQTGGGWSALDKITDFASEHITHWMYIQQPQKGE